MAGFRHFFLLCEIDLIFSAIYSSSKAGCYKEIISRPYTTFVNKLFFPMFQNEMEGDRGGEQHSFKFVCCPLVSVDDRLLLPAPSGECAEMTILKASKLVHKVQKSNVYSPYH